MFQQEGQCVATEGVGRGEKMSSERHQGSHHVQGGLWAAAKRLGFHCTGGHRVGRAGFSRGMTPSHPGLEVSGAVPCAAVG